MDIKYFDSVRPETYGMKKTEDITAKRLLALFVDSSDAFLDELEKSRACRVVRFIARYIRDKGEKDLSDEIGNILLSVTDAFLQFIAECPHVHVTID